MTDTKPPKEPIQPKNRGGMGLVSFLSAVVAAGIANAFVDSPIEDSNREQEKVQKVASLEKKLIMLEQEVLNLDTYLTLAEAGTIEASQCDIADVILGSSEIIQEGATQERNLLSQVDVLTVSEGISYRKRQDEVSKKIKARAGQLKDMCQHLFAEEATAVPQDYPVPAEWWDKPDLSFNYDQ